MLDERQLKAITAQVSESLRPNLTKEITQDVKNEFTQRFNAQDKRIGILEETIKTQKSTIKKLHEKADLYEAKYHNQRAEHELTTELLYQSNKNNLSIKTPFYHFCLDREVTKLVGDYNRNAKQLQLHVIAHRETEDEKNQILKLSFYMTGHDKNNYYPVQINLNCHSLLNDYKENKLIECNTELFRKINTMNSYLNFEFLALPKLFAENSDEVKINRRNDLNFPQFINLFKKYTPIISDLKIILEHFFRSVLISLENAESPDKRTLPNIELGRTLDSELINHSARNGIGYSVIFKHIQFDYELEYERLIAKRNEQDSLCHIVLLGNGSIRNFRIIAMLKDQKLELLEFELSTEKVKTFSFPQSEETEQGKLINEYTRNVNEFFNPECIKHLIKPLEKENFEFPITEIKQFMVICRKLDFVRAYFEYRHPKQKSEQAILFDDIDQENIFLIKDMGKNNISIFFATDRSDNTLIITYRLYNLYKHKKDHKKFFEREPVKNLLSNLVLLAAILDKIANAKTAYDNPQTYFPFWDMWTLTSHIKNYRTMDVDQRNNLIGNINTFIPKLNNHLRYMAKGGLNNYQRLKEEVYTNRYGYHV